MLKQITSWERNIFLHNEILWCSSHTLNATNNTKKKKGIIRIVTVFIVIGKELLEFWIQQQNYTKIVEKLGIHYPQ